MGELNRMEIEVLVKKGLGNRNDLDDTIPQFIDWAQAQIISTMLSSGIVLRELLLESSIDTVVDDPAVIFPVMVKNIFSVRLIDGVSSKRLSYTTNRRFDALAPDSTSMASGTPSMYTVVSNNPDLVGLTLNLYRVPGAIYPIKLRYLAGLPPLVYSDKSPLVGMDEIIVALATAKGHLLVGNQEKNSVFYNIGSSLLNKHLTAHGVPYADVEISMSRGGGGSGHDYWLDPFNMG